MAFNSYENGGWRKEARSSGFPFDCGTLTTIEVVPSSADGGYNFYANGKFIYTFKYRNNGTPDKIKYLAIMKANSNIDLEAKQLMERFAH